ncbi:hypothetical protein DPX39_060034900 [Trypanosoma brucei equiperdum]|nr:hypothetical protein DPX39_060034900 [Trypanosoma brucei equiperdum]
MTSSRAAGRLRSATKRTEKIKEQVMKSSTSVSRRTIPPSQRKMLEQTQSVSQLSEASTGNLPPHKLSQRELVRVHGWEPVVKPLRDTDAVSLPGTATTSVVWRNDITNATLIPNDVGGGVRTRRAAARLAAGVEPPNYLVYSRDPHVKSKRRGQHNVHVTEDVLSASASGAVLSGVSLTSSKAVRSRWRGIKSVDNGENKQQDGNEIGEDKPNSVGDDDAKFVGEGNGEKRQDGRVKKSEGPEEIEEENGADSIDAKEEKVGKVEDMGEMKENVEEQNNNPQSDEEITDQSEDEKESGEEVGNETPAEDAKNREGDGDTPRGRRRRGLASWLSRRRSRFGCERRKRRRAEAVTSADGQQQQQQQQRIGTLSASQAMLPPPYRRNRRLKRKLDVTEDSPIFASHAELRDKASHIFARAPFSTDEDVLRSTIDWRDNPTLLYARLLWELAPREFLGIVTKRQEERTASSVLQGANSTISVKKE